MALPISDKTAARILSEARENAPFDASVRDRITAIDNVTGNDTVRAARKAAADTGLLSDLSTARNRMLITEPEQRILQNTVIGFFGLSVGSHAAVTWIMESRARAVKLIDPDIIDPTNLNRLRSGWTTIGKYKTEVTAAEIRALSPATNVITARKTDDRTTYQMFTASPGLAAIVDEVDSIASKFLFREYAKKLKIPLISATDVGDTVVVDIERYDREPDLIPFVGRIDYDRYRTMDLTALTPKERIRLVLDIVGLEYCSNEMLESLLGLGTTVKTWPQLGATAVMAGGIITTLLKKIFLREAVPSGRFVVSLDSILGLKGTKRDAKHRKELLGRIKTRFMI